MALSVSPLNAYDKWEWYSGYTALLSPKSKKIKLSKASIANSHKELALVELDIDYLNWHKLELDIEGSSIRVLLNNEIVIDYKDQNILECSLFAIVTGDVDDSFHLNDLWEEEKKLKEESCEIAIQDLNYCTDQNYKITFEMNPAIIDGEDISLRWKPIKSTNVDGKYNFVNGQNAWYSSSKSQSFSFQNGKGELGIYNAGLKGWGINLIEGKSYDGYLRIKSDKPMDVVLSFRDRDNTKVYASKRFRLSGNFYEYEKISFDLIPTHHDNSGTFAITIEEPGTLYVGYLFLQPGEWGRYKGLPIRVDLAEALKAQGINLLRLNGGMIEKPNYRWANMQGEFDLRPPYDGFYDRYCSNGYGVIEHLNFCEALEVTPIIGLNIDEEPEDIADFIEYCNGEITTPAGKRRSDAGHKEPYKIKYYQVANESSFNREYVEKFKRVAEAIWKIDPEITLITTGNVYTFTGKEKINEVKEKLSLHIELTKFVYDKGKKIILDTHAFNTSDDPGQALKEGGNTKGAIEFSKWLTRLNPELGVVSIGMFEFNAGRFNYLRALSHAVEMNVVQRAGDLLVAAGMPNVSQPWEVYQDDWKAVLWTQGNIYYTQEKVWFQPAYYVDKMIANNWIDLLVESAVKMEKPELFDALAGYDCEGNLILRIINLSDHWVTVRIDIKGFCITNNLIHTELLTGNLDDYNTLKEPIKIKPIFEIKKINSANNIFDMEFEKYSFTVLKIENIKSIPDV